MLPIRATFGAVFESTRHIVPGARSGSSSHLLRWLMSFGGVGLFCVAVIDSSVIPIPLPGSTDLLLLLLSAHSYTSIRLAISFVAWAFAGSVLGGYTTWSAGVKGGNAALEKLGRGRFVGRITGWVKRNGMLSVGIAALLPPPIPLLPFVLAAGALGVARGRFLLSYCVARFLRYAFVGWLGFTFGRRVVILFQKELKGWSTTIISIYIGLVAVGAAYGIWKYLRDRRK
jgi:membrane protein YqaA with SNARE-associated domain